MRRLLRLATVTALVLAVLAGSAAAKHESVAIHADSAAANSPQMAINWDTYAVNDVRAATTLDGQMGGPPRSLYQVEGLVYMSYVEGAVYDAVTAIDPRYRPYHYIDADAAGASIPAAVAAASYYTLVHYLPDPFGVVSSEYQASIGSLPAGDATNRGIAVGMAAATDMEQLRAGDGLDAPTAVYGAPFTYTTANAGQWQVVPPSTVAQTPWVAFMRPFTLQSASQFRVPPPPALNSPQYTADFNETKDYGAVNSTVRTGAETAVAWFWNANVVSQDNQLYRDLVAQHNMDLVDAVHLMAMGNMTVVDAGIACWDSKYNYLRWRPYSAIQHADIDGNPNTTADPSWLPLLSTPNHPEYPAAHGCLTSALANVLAEALGTQNINATFWGSTGGATTLTKQETFATTDQLRAEIVNARVWAGLHWRTSVVVGEGLGEDTSNWTLGRYFGARTAGASCPADGTTWNGNVDVSAGSYCDLSNVTVHGNVTVGSGGAFSDAGGQIVGNVQAQGGDLELSSASVSGNVQSHGGAVDLSGISVGGNVQLEQGTGAITVCTSQIHGNLQLQSSSVPANLCGNTVGGNIEIHNNSAAVSVNGNTVGGNLQCQNDSPAATSSANTVKGNTQGECA